MTTAHQVPWATCQLLGELRSTYPRHEFQLLAKANTRYAQDGSAANHLIALQHEGEVLPDLIGASLDRLREGPVSTYQLTRYDVLRISLHNGIKSDDATRKPLMRLLESAPEGQSVQVCLALHAVLAGDWKAASFHLHRVGQKGASEWHIQCRSMASTLNPVQPSQQRMLALHSKPRD